jgi:hypothetical protein
MIDVEGCDEVMFFGEEGTNKVQYKVNFVYAEGKRSETKSLIGRRLGVTFGVKRKVVG